MSDLLERLEALRQEYRDLADEYEKDGDEDARNRSLLVAYKVDAIIADERKRREPVEMSCPSCEKVTRCFESREMCCSECLAMFETPEQLDANLDADRKARGMPAAEHKAPDPRDALLAQAREALEWAEWGDDDHCPVCGHAVDKHSETCELSLAIAAIDKHMGRKP